MKKKDFIIIAAVLAIAVALLLIVGKPVKKSDNGSVVIYVGNQNEVYETVPLSEPKTVVIDQGNGMINEVQITNNGVHMRSSTCKNQDCVEQGEVNIDNYELRPLTSWIICLPNQVAVEFMPPEDDK